MKSLMMEFLRFGKGPRILCEGDDYLAISGAKLPVRPFEMPLNHADFLDFLFDLRYKVSESDRQKALNNLSDLVTQILQPPPPQDKPLQLDLVTSATELWALPFEAARRPDGKPLLVNPNQVVVLTRRIRQQFADETPFWPSHPRVLFASASPKWAGPQVPVEEHKEELRAALKPWIEPLELEGFADAIPDERDVLHIIEKASLEDIEQSCKEAREMKKPFTHVHILAHGKKIVNENRPHRARFGLALHSKRQEPIEAIELAKVLRPIGLKLEERMPVVVTLASCDAGNDANSVAPSGSIAQALHQSGIPVVVASQLPLTFQGSTVLTREFYRALLSGVDVRESLYKTRLALSQEPKAKHDWVSLVAYVQLPEGYTEHLLDVQLEAELASLKTIQCWSDLVIERKIQSDAVFERVAGMLKQRIDSLASFLKKTKKSKKGVLEENRGLLGSAYKRLAELLFIRASVDQKRKNKWLNESRKALEKARRSYVEGNNHNLSHHWTGVQHLSLETVLTGNINAIEYWHASLKAAEIDRQNKKEFWAQGSIAELFLLAPFVVQSSKLDKALAALVEMKQRVQDYADDDFPIESTLRQLRRYTKWWTKENGFFRGCEKDLTEDANSLIEVLAPQK